MGDGISQTWLQNTRGQPGFSEDSLGYEGGLKKWYPILLVYQQT